MNKSVDDVMTSETRLLIEVKPYMLERRKGIIVEDKKHEKEISKKRKTMKNKYRRRERWLEHSYHEYINL